MTTVLAVFTVVGAILVLALLGNLAKVLHMASKPRRVISFSWGDGTSSLIDKSLEPVAKRIREALARPEEESILEREGKASRLEFPSEREVVPMSSDDARDLLVKKGWRIES